MVLVEEVERGFGKKPRAGVNDVVRVGVIVMLGVGAVAVFGYVIKRQLLVNAEAVCSHRG